MIITVQKVRFFIQSINSQHFLNSFFYNQQTMENNNVFLVTDELVATQGKRFLNLLIDRVMFYVVVFALSLLVGVIFRVVGYYEGLD